MSQKTKAVKRGENAVMCGRCGAVYRTKKAAENCRRHELPKQHRSRVVHRRYSDKRGRADLKALVLCNNINGPLPGARLTGKPVEVTCGRCLRIMYPSWKNPRRRPFSDADLRRMALEDLSPRNIG